MKKLIVLLSLSLAVGLVSPLYGLMPITVEIEPATDVMVSTEAPDTVISTETELYPFQLGVRYSVGNIGMAYLQYLLPEDFVVPLSAQVDMVQVYYGTNVDFLLYTINDDTLIGDPNTYTWNNSPAHDPCDLVVKVPTVDGHHVNLEEAAYIGLVRLASAGGPGAAYSIDVLANALENQIATDTDGEIQMILFRNQVLTTVTDKSVASLENTSYEPVTLVLTYYNATADVAVSDPNIVNVNEEGETTDTYTVVLTAAPEGTVTITAADASGNVLLDAGSGFAASADLLFDNTNWDTPQTVTVKAVDDELPEGPHTAEITHSLAAPNPDDAIFLLIDAPSIIANITDNDPVCGMPGTNYLPGDINLDCYVDLDDFAMLATDWMLCTDPANPENCILLPE